MRRIVIMIGIGVLSAVLLGAGSSAFGEGVGREGNRSGATVTTGANEHPEPNAAAPPGSAGSDGTVTSDGPAAPPAAAPAIAAPPPAATPTTPTSPAAANKGACPQGEKQREVEVALAGIGAFGPVTVDGVQSADDCAAITKFQKRFGISPANGRAGPTTGDVARRIAAGHTADVRARCRGASAGSGLTVCIDLSLQIIWVTRGGSVVFGPSVVRTGFRGFATPAGTYRISSRNIREWSNPYEVWMPYWQRFNGGIGLHETVSYLHNGGAGSHGCANLLRSDAKELWNLLGVGTTVHTFGRRPGT